MLTRKEFENVVKARKLYAMVERPSNANFVNMVKLNLLPDSPISLQDVKNAEFLFGPDLGSLKGKSIQESPKQVTTKYIHIPHELIDLHHDVNIAADIMEFEPLHDENLPTVLNTTSANKHVPGIEQQNW
eukprot:4371044-Ditylum_brightwellii.AAC.1